MKIAATLFSFLFLHIISFGQDRSDRSVTEPVTKITFIEPGIAHEFTLGPSTTFFLRGGLTASVALDFYDHLIFLYRPFASGSFRAYYNFRKRDLMEKNTAKNSANYLALLAILRPPPFNKSDNYDRDYNETFINTGVVWGMQRNYPSGFSLDLNIGAGYFFFGSSHTISLVSELNIGWWLGKKNKNRH